MPASLSMNDFFHLHYTKLAALSKKCALNVHNRFKDIATEDLEAEAMFALYLASKRVRADGSYFPAKYLFINAYGRCLQAVMRYKGVKRIRRKKNFQHMPITDEELEEYKSFCTIPLDPQDLIHVSDAHQITYDECESLENKIIFKLDVERIYKRLPNHLQKDIFALILRGETSKDICELLNLSTSTFYYQTRKLGRYIYHYHGDASCLLYQLDFFEHCSEIDPKSDMEEVESTKTKKRKFRIKTNAIDKSGIPSVSKANQNNLDESNPVHSPSVSQPIQT